MLDRLVALGAPVPPTGVVTTTAYRSYVDHARLRPRLERLAAEPPPAPDRTRASQREVDGWFLGGPLPEGLADAIAELARDVGAGASLAVRSSATAEDLGSASFAGQYHTALDVDHHDVVDAVRRCWASLWYPGPHGYRRFHEIDESDVAMAVVLMPMLHPSRAGVLFTQDPTRPTAIRIEMVTGLGEALVSGASTPDVVTVDRHRIDDDAEPPWVRSLATMALDLEAQVGQPLDIEWALADDDLVLLQARPITGPSVPTGRPDDDGFDVARSDTRYTTAGIGEMLPGVLAPRLWDVNSWLVEEGFRTLFDDLGAATHDLVDAHALVGRVRGRAALDLDRMERVVDSVPGGSSAELEHQYFGDILEPDDAPTAPPDGRTRVTQGVRTLRARARAYRDSERAIQAVRLVLDGEPDHRGLDTADLLAMRSRILHLGALVMEAEVGVAATASASYRSLELFLREHLPVDEATVALQRLTVNERAEHRGRRALDLDRLAARLETDTELVDARDAASWERLHDALDATPSGRRFLDELRSALRRGGSISVFGGTTWDEAPDLVWPMLHSARRRSTAATRVTGVATDRAAVLAELERTLASTSRWRFTRWSSGHLVDVRRRFLRREAVDATAFLARREETKATLLMLGGVARRIDRELGRRLVTGGVIDDVDDIDLLVGDEIAAGLRGEPLPPASIELRRRRLDAARLEPPLDRIFRGRPEPRAAAPPVGDRFTGWTGSPGRFEGEARVVESPKRSALRRGDVLVARTTDASWLPLFHVAGAVVVEQGGPLSHASILARELGMPAVINVPGIVARVRREPGCLLTVDGTAGEVAVHSPTPAAGDADGDEADRLASEPIDPTDGVAPTSSPPAVADPDRLGVFITGLIGAGALMSIAIGLTQAIGSAHTQQRISARARLPAEALATGTLHGYEPDAVGSAGLRPRGYFGWLAVSALVPAVLAVWMGDDYVESPSSAPALWLLALGLLSAVPLTAVAMNSLRAAVTWPTVSAVARRLSLPRAHENLTPTRLIGRTYAGLAASLLLLVGAIAWLVAEAEGVVLRIDEWVFDLVGAGTRDNWWYPDVVRDAFRAEVTLPLLGRTAVIIPLVIVMTFAVYRCRPLLFTYPLVVAGAGFLHLFFQHFVTRDRPELGLKPGFDDSFPGGHANELTVLLGLLPLVVHVLTRHDVLRVVLEVLCAITLALALADSVRVGDHWPIDNAAGFMIGAAMVLIARGVARSPDLHTRCRECPFQRAREKDRTS
jgi:phosphohistidine swiveling domain-containing protein